ncbi:MAG: lytic murein transglycosylase B [Pseudomonadota bacterium]|jgi:membrane-bound lytic murein transglycosylase B
MRHLGIVGLIIAAALCYSVRAQALDLQRPDVANFIDEVVKRDHLDRDWVEKMLAAAELKPAIIETMKKPAEHVLQWHEYRKIFITTERIRQGHEFLAEHGAMLAEVAARTGVPVEIITAIVGVETSYGRKTGRYRVLDALATLGFDYPARAAFFRAELEQFLLLAKEAGVDPLTATGSYAGAMGAPQFMPRSFRAFAQDGDHDGKIDLWTNWRDIAESVAHYFVAHGWRRGAPVYVTARLEDPDVEALPGNKLDPSFTLAELGAKGVLFECALPDEDKGLFIALRDLEAPRYLVGLHNFTVITKYNHSALYALAVAQLAEALSLPAEPVASP